jgi:hypothetical protein
MTEKKSCNLAIDVAVQSTKLFIALATSVLAFTVTFSDKINNGQITCSVIFAWCFLGFSIAAGVFVLQKIVGELDDKGKVWLYKPSIRWASLLQNLSFLVGIFWVAALVVTK